MKKQRQFDDEHNNEIADALMRDAALLNEEEEALTGATEDMKPADKRASEKGDNRFLKGTLILTVSSIVVKVIGALNWILLSRVLGGEGIGLYQMGFPIYLMAITVSSAGIPVAISIVTAEKVAQNDFKGAEAIIFIFTTAVFCA